MVPQSHCPAEAVTAGRGFPGPGTLARGLPIEPATRGPGPPPDTSAPDLDDLRAVARGVGTAIARSESAGLRERRRSAEGCS